MLYVIKLSELVLSETDPELDSSRMMIKIGYSSDEEGLGEKRLNTYRNGGLRKFRVLFQIPNVNLQLEQRIHHYFRKYREIDSGNEWYQYNKEIVDFFKEHDTVEDLEKVVPELTIKKTIQKALTKEGRTFENFLVNEKDASQEVIDLLTEFYKKTTFINKMKLICKSNLSSVDLQIIFNYIPYEYEKYYNTLGPKVIISCGCQRNKAEIEYQRAIQNQGSEDRLLDCMYDKFTVGDRYSCSEAKKMISNIYSECNYRKSPKATDLGNYFELKYCKVDDPIIAGKRNRGFEIIKRKY